jgi:hypothetical protein
MTAPPTWPSDQAHTISPHRDYASASPCDEALCQEQAQAVIGEVAGLLRDTRGQLMADGSILGAVTLGIAMQAGPVARALRPTVEGAVSLVLLSGMLICWIAAASVLAMSTRPVLNALSELRWATGAPLDPRPGWVTLPPAGADPADWTWHRALLLVGAARLARHRMLFADTWTYLAGGYFLAWSVVIMLGR